ncbi:MAG: hypothetical protein HOZ81_20110 [Streptomyces sp.]|nr:hypothetical protein [Streptomyces sp.]NUS81846.1 hypothetical protein [Streptomyces sp.]
MASPTQTDDVVAEALATVWTEAHREFGPDETTWTAAQRREYDLRLDAARFDPQVVA